ncbi:MAG: NAD(P)H-hydrate epimerase [Anaerolineae bacterium]
MRPVPRPLKIVTTDQMRDLERRADQAGHSYAAMMERAGHAVAAAVHQEWPPGMPGRVLVLAGPGNNGGDGLVAARYLLQWGHAVRVYCCHRSSEGDSNYQRLVEMEAPLARAEDDAGGSTLATWLRDTVVIVDALLGTGVTRPIAGLLKQTLDRVREAPGAGPGEAEEPGPAPQTVTDRLTWPAAPEGPARGRGAVRGHPLVVAVDCPSGLNCDTGALDPAAIPADVTVTFAYPKVGHFQFPGAAAVGRLAVADIAIPPSFAEDIPIELATAEGVAPFLPARPTDAHKGTFGKALVVAGSVNYTGAAYLAAAGAARSGVGLVTVASPRPLHPILASRLAEATWLLLPHNLGVIAPEAIKVLKGALKEYDALLLGPGLTQEKEVVQFVREFLTQSSILGSHPLPSLGFLASEGSAAAERDAEADSPWPPLVIDADGLNALAQHGDWPGWLAGRQAILTPHPGEMARLRRLSLEEIQSRRWYHAQEAARAWQQVVVLKGAYTAIGLPDGRLVISPFANPALATAGSGDVLAGTITGLLAQGLSPAQAAVAGTYIHGLAGELARQEVGEAGTLAGDLLPLLPKALRAIYAFKPAK